MNHPWISVSTSSLLLLTPLTIFINTGSANAVSLPKTLPLTQIQQTRDWSQGLPHTPFYQAPTVTENLHAIDNLSRSREASIIIDSASRVSALLAYSHAVNTPGNPLFHHFLSPAQLDAQFGPTPQMISQSEGALKAAGWKVLSQKGLVLDAMVPARLKNPSIPIAPDIWSASGLSPVRTLPNDKTATKTTSATNLSTYGFRQTPAFSVSTAEANGDIVTAVSWNPNFTTSLPAGLPWTLAISVQSPSGTPQAISNVANLSDPANNIGAFSYNTASFGSVFPGSNNTLWQLECEAFGDNPAGDTLNFNVVLSSGITLPMTVSLPAFTGPSDALNPLTGPQLSSIVGSGNLASEASASSRAPIAIYTQGQVPSLTDLQQLMSMENLPMPNVNFQYFDGATATMTSTLDFPESELDLQAVASVNPGANVTEYVYPENDPSDTFVSMLSTLSQQSSIKIASFSYGFYGENASTVATVVAACNAEGITIIDGSGDQGAWETGSDPGPVGVESNDGQPGIVSVGGLDLASGATFDSSGNQTSVTGPAVAKAWGGDYLNGLPLVVSQDYTSPNAASTGGYGTTPIPSWQASFLPSSATGIGVPDIASLAGTPGLLGIIGGQYTYLGGTSLSAPVTAGWLSDLEGAINASSTGLGNINPQLFNAAHIAPQDFTQALWGANGVYSVTSPVPGSWNPVTGLGQPHWDALATLWSASEVASLAVVPPSTTVSAGTPVSFTVTALDAAGNPVTSFSGPVSVTSSDAQASLPSSIDLVNGQGSVTVTFATPGPESITVDETAGPSPIVGSTSVSVVSPLAISSSPTSAVAGQSLSITALAPLSHPTYQFWVYNPGSQQWQQSGPYSSTATYRWVPNVPGTYTIIVYAKNQSSSSWAYFTKTQIVVASPTGHPMVSGLSVSTPQIDQPSGASVTFTAQATDIGGTPLYQFWVHGPNNQWIQAQNFSDLNQYTLTDLAPGSYVVAVNALDKSQVVSQSWHQVYYYSTVVNVGSSITLNAPSTGTLNTTIAVSAGAQGITNPVYQFWVQTPTGQWTQRGFGTNTFSFTPTLPGTYVIAVYAKDPYALALPPYDVMTSKTITIP